MVGGTVAEMTVAVGVELVVVEDGAGMLVATGVVMVVIAGAGMVAVLAEVFLLQRDR